MNSIINHLGEESPQKNKLIYEDYTFIRNVSQNYEANVSSKSVRRSAVYAELLTATCTKYINNRRYQYL